MLMRHSLIGWGNSLLSRENSLFFCVGNFAANHLIYRAKNRA